MSEAIPVLGVSRQVRNIGPQQIGALQGRLLEKTDGSDAALETVQGLFVPGPELYSSIIGRAEFLRIQRKLGEDSLPMSDVEALEAQVIDALSDCPEEMDVDTVPTGLKRWGALPKLALTIAGSRDVIHERHIAQGVISRFLGYRRLPKGWFGRAKKTTPVELAASRTGEELILLKKLKLIIDEDGLVEEQHVEEQRVEEEHVEEEHMEEAPAEESGRLPAKTKLGKIDTGVSLKYFRD